MSEIRGIVLEIKGEQAHVLTDGGDFIICDANRIAVGVGEEVLIGEKQEKTESKVVTFPQKSFALRQLAVAATLLIAVIGGTWFYPSDWLYLEINPSIAMKLNVYNRVIGYEGLNQDGNQVASQVQVYGKPIETALDESFKVIEKDGYMTKTKSNAVIIGYGSEQVKTKASNQVASIVKREKLPTTVATIPVKSETIASAKAEAASPINLEIIKKNNKIDKKEWSKELRKMEKMKTLDIIKSNRKDKTVDVQNEPVVDPAAPPIVPDPILPDAVTPSEPVLSQPNSTDMDQPSNVNMDQSLLNKEKPVKGIKKDKAQVKKEKKLKEPGQNQNIQEQNSKPPKTKTKTKIKNKELPQQEKPIKKPLNPEKALKKPLEESVPPESTGTIQGKGVKVPLDKVALQEKIRLLKERISKLEANRQKISQSNLPEEEKNKKISDINQKLDQIKKQLEKIKAN